MIDHPVFAFRNPAEKYTKSTSVLKKFCTFECPGQLYEGEGRWLQKRGKVGTLLPARSEAGQTWRPRPRKWRSYKSNWCPRACQACLICPWVSNNSNIPWQARGKTAFFYTVLFCPVGCPSYGQYPKKGFWIWILGVFLILKTRVAIT